jgi:hypothetical protein
MSVGMVKTSHHVSDSGSALSGERPRFPFPAPRDHSVPENASKNFVTQSCHLVFLARLPAHKGLSPLLKAVRYAWRFFDTGRIVGGVRMAERTDIEPFLQHCHNNCRSFYCPCPLKSRRTLSACSDAIVRRSRADGYPLADR